MWTNDLVLEFIGLYGKHPVVWDPNDINYKSRVDAAQAWLDIQSQLSQDFSVRDLKRKKESLMTSYRILKKKVLDSAKSGKKQVYKPTWFAFEPLDRILRRTGKSKFTKGAEEVGYTDPEEDISGRSTESDDEIKLSEVKVENIKRESVNEVVRAVKKKRIITDDIKVERVKAQTADVLQLQRQVQHIQTDECELYGALLATKLRTLDTRNRKIITNQIDNLVFEAEMNQMDQTSQILPIISNAHSSPSNSYTSN